MPVAPTYPGVYIEEIPSGVHTITGVATSITAFVGYTARGPVNRGVRILSMADFERDFGGLAIDSPLSYAVQQFFQNGGTDAVVVRVALNAAAARVSLATGTGAGAPVALIARAVSEGTWGNNLRLDVDYEALNPASLFNLTVVEMIEQNGRMVPGRTEVFRNLSMNSFDSTYVVSMVNAGSELVRLERPAGLAFAGNGTSRSGPVTDADLEPLYAANPPDRVAFSLNGGPPIEIVVAPLTPFPPAVGRLDQRLDDIAAVMTQAMVARTSAGAVAVTHTAGDAFLVATSAATGERSAIHFFDASSNSATRILRLGTENGGVETDAAAAVRPAQTGTVGGPAALAGLGANAAIDVNVMRGNNNTPLNGGAPLRLPLWGVGSGTPPVVLPTTVAGVLAALRRALARSTEPLLAGATAQLIGGRLRLLPRVDDPDVWFSVLDVGGGDTTATIIGLESAVADENVGRYAPGIGVARFAQIGAVPGNNGTIPLPAQFRGLQADKTGLYALEDVDLFNILCLPEVSDFNEADMLAVYGEALAYCLRRRAFLIVDLPGRVDTLGEAQTWISTTAQSLRSRNAAAYFPRIRQPDPLSNNVVRAFAPSGALAGLYARTDAERGVWKAPAGTAAAIAGATGLAVALNDRENGVLNPLGLNVLRTFPVYGTVSWGARTLRGADALTDEYKYVPVRRLALFLEESLYRGTQWVVFEPNDEPLWAQIRLNLGAFMHTLFSQGAFQGRTPREAYFVKCDKETTTQNDIDLGRVNIVVGFAPLKPAEFVIIKIQQIAPPLQT
jgi:phage tail sheath protein FI